MILYNASSDNRIGKVAYPFNSRGREISYTKLPYDELIASIEVATGVTKTQEIICSDGVNPVYSWRIGACDGSKEIVLMHGGIHGAHEWRCAYWLREFMRQLLFPVASDNRMANDIKSKYDFCIIPVLNPYGYINGVRQNANDVDLNRNYEQKWREWVSTPSTYKGTAPLSEVETQLVANKINQYKPILYVDWHTEGDPVNGTDGLAFLCSRQPDHVAFLTRMAMWTLREIELRDGKRYPNYYQMLWDAPISITYGGERGVMSLGLEPGGGLTVEENAKLSIEFMWRVCYGLANSSFNDRLGRPDIFGTA